MDLRGVGQVAGAGLGHDHRGRPEPPRGLQRAGPRHQVPAIVDTVYLKYKFKYKAQQVPHHQPPVPQGSHVEQLQGDAEEVRQEVLRLHARDLQLPGGGPPAQGEDQEVQQHGAVDLQTPARLPGQRHHPGADAEG